MLNKIVTDRANSFRYFVKNPNRENLSKINAPIIARIVKIERIWASLNFPVALKINNDDPDANRFVNNFPGCSDGHFGFGA